MSTAALQSTDYDYIRKLIRDRSGIVFEEGKEYLMDARLASLARRENLESICDLVAKIRLQPLNGLHEKVVDAMTINETLFFRDIHPFEALRNHLFPELLKQRAAVKNVNIWCAACSSGQEPYSTAIAATEFFRSHPGWTVRIVASDISAEMINRAMEGRYTQLEINRGLPAPILVKYFEKAGVEWRVKEEIRSMVRFLRMNLIETWPYLPNMDIIFLRNVLIYFDVETKKAILTRVRRLMAPDGHLFLGGAETTLYLDQAFEQVYYGKASCCRLRNS